MSETELRRLLFESDHNPPDEIGSTVDTPQDIPKKRSISITDERRKQLAENMRKINSERIAKAKEKNEEIRKERNATSSRMLKKEKDKLMLDLLQENNRLKKANEPKTETPKVETPKVETPKVNNQAQLVLQHMMSMQNEINALKGHISKQPAQPAPAKEEPKNAVEESKKDNSKVNIAQYFSKNPTLF